MATVLQLPAAAASLRGGDVDALLALFVGVCGIALVVVHIAGFIAWRGKPSRLGRPVLWALAAVLGLVGLFIVSERGWQALKFDRLSDSQLESQKLLVVGERFAWSVVYPGDDGELGGYLAWPRPTDALWPNPEVVDAATAAAPPPFTFAGVAGPAELPEDERADAIARYREAINPLGKDFADPLGWDDDWHAALGRNATVEAGRPVEISLGSKDVIHDYFIPAMRAKLDAVPGMLGTLRFTPTTPGTYRVLCAEFCGWGHTQMLGELVVEEAK